MPSAKQLLYNQPSNKRQIRFLVYLGICNLGKNGKLSTHALLYLFLIPGTQEYFEKLISKLENVYKAIRQV